MRGGSTEGVGCTWTNKSLTGILQAVALLVIALGSGCVGTLVSLKVDVWGQSGRGPVATLCWDVMGGLQVPKALLVIFRRHTAGGADADSQGVSVCLCETGCVWVQ